MAVALAAIGVHYVVQRCIGPRILAEQNNVAGFIYSAIAVTYAVVLGFVVVVVWEKYGDVQNHTDAEVAALFDLYHTAKAFPQPLRHQIRADLRGYVDDVITKEWPEMTKGTLALGAVSDVENIAQEIETFSPANMGQQDAHQIAMQELLRAFDARRERILATSGSVPPILWFGLIAGASATLGFTFFFGVQNRVVQALDDGDPSRADYDHVHSDQGIRHAIPRTERSHAECVALLRRPHESARKPGLVFLNEIDVSIAAVNVETSVAGTDTYRF